jgi:hypothetical protein
MPQLSYDAQKLGRAGDDDQHAHGQVFKLLRINKQSIDVAAKIVEAVVKQEVKHQARSDCDAQYRRHIGHPATPRPLAEKAHRRYGEQQRSSDPVHEIGGETELLGRMGNNIHRTRDALWRSELVAGKHILTDRALHRRAMPGSSRTLNPSSNV